MTLETDHQGFLKNAQDWTLDWASQCAAENGILWEQIDQDIVNALRSFYFEFDLSPAMRPLVKHIKNTVGADYGNSIWLMHRYGESPARMLALIAGLPKPKNCL
jgi:tRNA 2-thiouridine synthesizing protein E